MMRGRATSAFLVLLLSLGLSSSAAAISMLPNPVVDATSGTTVTITMTGSAVGSGFGETVLSGAIGASDISLLFTVTVSGPGALEGGVLPDLQIGILDPDGGCFGFACATSAGRIDPAGGADPVLSASVQAANLGADFFFNPDVGPNSTSQEFFVSFNPTTPFALDGSESVAFMVAIDSGVPFNIVPAPLLVPEPATALLLACGLLSLGAGARSRNRR